MHVENVFLGLGSNVGNREAYLEASVDAIGKLKTTEILRKSSIYETEPWGVEGQEPFLNQVLEIETRLKPDDLYTHCQNIERVLGRKKNRNWRPREIDIDLLLYGNRVINSETVQVPHPYLADRRFVLVPLAEIAHRLMVPGLNRCVRELLDVCTDSKSVRLYRAFQVH